MEHSSCFIGPQIYPFDSYGKFLVENPQFYNKLLVPSDWTRNQFINKFNVPEKQISLFPVGIDNLFKYKLNNSEIDCLIYFKSRSIEDLEYVKNFLKLKN